MDFHSPNNNSSRLNFIGVGVGSSLDDNVRVCGMPDSSYHDVAANSTTQQHDVSSGNHTSYEHLNNGSTEDEFYDYKIDYILHGIIITVLVSFGLLGNIIAVYVFTRPRHWPCINYYLVALAFWDLALLTGSFLLFALPTLLFGGMPTYGAYVEIYPYFYVFSNITLNGSEWIVVMLTVERFLAIYRPLQHRTFLNTHTRVKTILMAVSVAAILYNVPRMFDLQIVTCRDEMGQSQSTVERTWLYNDYWFRTIYKVIGNLLFVYAGPFLVLSTLTIFICMEIRRATVSNRVVLKLPETSAQQQDNNNIGANSLSSKKVSLRRTVLVMSKHQSVKDLQCSRQQSNNVNVMSVLVVGKFLVCFSLPTISDILELIMSDEKFNQLGLLVTLGNVFVVFNSSCNFLIYFIFGKTFRRCLLRHLRRFLEKIFKNTTFPFGNSSAEEPNSVTASLVSSQHSSRRHSNVANHKRNSYAAVEVNNCHSITSPQTVLSPHSVGNCPKNTAVATKNDFWV